MILHSTQSLCSNKWVPLLNIHTQPKQMSCIAGFFRSLTTHLHEFAYCLPLATKTHRTLPSSPSHLPPKLLMSLSEAHHHWSHHHHQAPEGACQAHRRPHLCSNSRGLSQKVLASFFFFSSKILSNYHFGIYIKATRIWLPQFQLTSKFC